MFHAEAVDRSRVVGSDLLLLSVEADTLADDRLFRTGRTPDGKGHLEADGEDALAGLAGPRTKRMSGPLISATPVREGGSRGAENTHLPANLLAEVVPSCSGGT